MTELFLFARDDLVPHAAELGIDAIVVDLERRGKHTRQQGAGTDISVNDIDDVRQVRGITDLPVICRIDGLGTHRPAQIEAVLDAGIDEILIPMVRRSDEVAATITQVAGRAAVGVMVETVDAVEQAGELASMALSRVYVGLNDLWIDRRGRHRFDPFVDGTIDALAHTFRHTPFGVAGLTHPDLGHPLPCRHLINELSRIGCDYTFLRRSFFDAIEQRPVAEVCAAIRGQIATASRRDANEIEQDRRAAHRAISALAAEPVGAAV
jgi:HpcH/HpaI aldolase/citrate lyase family protein